MNREKNIRFMTTHNAIQEALLLLIHQRRKVTVNAICEYANINRSAFYLHYNDIQSLLAEIQNCYFDELKDQFVKADTMNNIFCLKGYKTFCKFVKEHKDFYQIYFENHTAFPVEDGQEDLLKNAELYFAEKKITSKKEVYYRLCAAQSAMANVLKAWLKHECDLSCDEMARILDSTICF